MPPCTRTACGGLIRTVPPLLPDQEFPLLTRAYYESAFAAGRLRVEAALGGRWVWAAGLLGCWGVGLSTNSVLRDIGEGQEGGGSSCSAVWLLCGMAVQVYGRCVCVRERGDRSRYATPFPAHLVEGAHPLPCCIHIVPPSPLSHTPLLSLHHMPSIHTHTHPPPPSTPAAPSA